ncbi:hypothetical protein CEP54_004637 [Fusarium duplospermum]|uniref:Uncharacterized protein n=1 Tax=Fusarium duplospermum TaxID=1325734 RepID=A0A428QGU3_9HYPO|nr:hypothetical protein CEP54_004637 [Fusarium duplospermum]
MTTKAPSGQLDSSHHHLQIRVHSSFAVFIEFADIALRAQAILLIKDITAPSTNRPLSIPRFNRNHDFRRRSVPTSHLPWLYINDSYCRLSFPRDQRRERGRSSEEGKLQASCAMMVFRHGR